MHHATIDRWSRQSSAIHRRDARVKVLAILALLVAIGTSRLPWAALAFLIPIAAAILFARLPLASLFARAAIVLPFAGVFAAISYATGDHARATSMLSKSYTSALGVLLLVATTPLPQLMNGLESLGVPRFLTLVVQFVYRYLFVVSEQAQHMLLAAACRSGGSKRPVRTFESAAGAIAVLFARSYQRAEGIHQAMLARGFEGHFLLRRPGRIQLADIAFLTISLAATAAIWTAARLV